MRRQLSFAIAKVRSNQEIVISSFGLNIPKAVRMAEIIKMRVPFLHQENSFQNSKEEDTNDEKGEKTKISINFNIKLS